MLSLIKKNCAIILLLTVTLLVCSISPSFALDNRVEASKVTLHTKLITKDEAKKNKNWVKQYYKGAVTGYITAKKRHYANVRLYLVGVPVKSSGRSWGKGKVSVSTGWWKGGCAITTTPYGRAIFYGF